MTSLLADAFDHHVWATERLIDACSSLTPEQLDAAVPGTYGSIVETLRHLVDGDNFYLRVLAGREAAPVDDATLPELRAAMTRNGGAWREFLDSDIDPEADVVERDEGWDFHFPAGIRLAQVVHHGTDHRSQVCTALTGLGVTPPEIDLWVFADVTGRRRVEEVAGQ
jgi:uncharacterized damage-inducible protein DinB